MFSSVYLFYIYIYAYNILENNWKYGEYLQDFCIVYKYTIPLERIIQENYFPYLSSQVEFYSSKQLKTIFKISS